MNGAVKLAEGFISFFQKTGDQIIANVAGTVPMLLGLLFLINFIIKVIGDKKITKIAEFLGKSAILSYLILPSFAWFFFSSPGALTVGKFLPEKRKPGFEDALGTTVHPLTSLFPHIVPAELFIWLGVANGITKLGLSTAPLAIRYIITGLILGLIRGVITEKIFVYFMKKNNKQVA